ncbi:hypothetical protein [Coxiella-like endosymbiont]|uniref:hypothetical protein n=1 Tax=Coxiella-like endosymbiont TaxID=1592897 RepID=UPI00272A4710|nr:hypothetical protein [Coxiella-like endosymbiont]
MLLTHFGGELYVDALNTETANNLNINVFLMIYYLFNLVEKQKIFLCISIRSDLYSREMRLFPDWYFKKYILKDI